MESPAICCSAWVGLSGEEGRMGLHGTSDSLSSCSSNWQYLESADSDDSDKHGAKNNHTLEESIDSDQDRSRFMFAAIKKTGTCGKHVTTEPIDPPLEFQDAPIYDSNRTGLEELAEGLVDRIVCDAVSWSEKEVTARSCRTPDLHSSRRPASRNSLNSRLSSSHNSLSVPAANKADDSSFITSAMSHDVLDLYNISLDGDIYTLPVDSLKPTCSQRLKKQQRQRKRRRNTGFITRDGTEAKPDGSVTDAINIQSEDIIVGRQTDTIRNCSVESGGYHSPVYNKRHSLPGPSPSDWPRRMHCNEPIHMTLHEVRQFLHNLYTSASSNRSWYSRQDSGNEGVVGSNTPDDDDDVKIVSDELMRMNNNSSINTNYNNNNNNNNNNGNKNNFVNNKMLPPNNSNSKNGLATKIKNRKSKSFNLEPDVKSFNNKNNKHSCTSDDDNKTDTKTNNRNTLLPSSTSKSNGNKSHDSGCGKTSFSYTIKQTLCNIFRFRRGEMSVSSQCHHSMTDTVLVLGVSTTTRKSDIQSGGESGPPPFAKRALPPLPSHNGKHPDDGDTKVYDDNNGVPANEEAISADAGVQIATDDDGNATTIDFASSIEKVKDYGWYWGPISGETAEKVLSNEPDGSFIVRDSSDDHYIFSLTFKLNGVIRHVRIEHDQGNFSFGSCAKFKSRTIVEFIENAVEHSRSGRYLFFLHRRPIHGPMRVQLLHPVSRFKQVQSLQHMCRFVILKVVRRDLIPSLPLPRRIIGYLNSPHYYCEHPSVPTSEDQYPSVSPPLHLFAFVPPNS